MTYYSATDLINTLGEYNKYTSEIRKTPQTIKLFCINESRGLSLDTDMTLPDNNTPVGIE